MSKLKLVIASDHAGFELKEELRAWLASQNYEIADLGTYSKDSVHYPDYANKAAESILAKEAAFGILICGSGIGVSIAANRHKGIRAALCHDVTSATLARQHNDANIICFGARFIGVQVAKDAVEAFLKTAFEGGRHQIRVEMMG